MPGYFATGDGWAVTDPSKTGLPPVRDTTAAGGLGEYVAVLDQAGIGLRDPGTPLLDYSSGMPMVDAMWRAQPSVRKVTDFIARNIASIPLHAYARISDTDRARVTGTPLAQVLTNPEADQPWASSPFRFWWRVMLDGLLCDRWLVLVDPATPSLTRVPPSKFRLIDDGAGRVTQVQIAVTGAQGQKGWRDVAPGSALCDWGYAPRGPRGGSPLTALAETLAEQNEAVRSRRQLWDRQARVSGVISRESSWPNAETRDRFVRQLGAFSGKDGQRSGGVMLLEDGMTFAAITPPKATDMADLEGRRLADIEVCSVYHIPPELVGAREGTFANVQAFRQLLYRDSLGPYLAALEGALQPLVTMLGAADQYVEANVAAKLRGSFEEQATILQTSVGAPWLTRNEARARANLPAIDGGDELVTPLNVLIGDQASPTDSGSQNIGGSGQLSRETAAKARQILADHATRQAKSILSRVGAANAAGDPAPDDWWQLRWDGELLADLRAAGVPLHLGIKANDHLAASVKSALAQPNWMDQARDALSPGAILRHVDIITNPEGQSS